MKLIDKYILKELFGPFVFGVGVFSILLVAGFIMPQLTQLFTAAQLNLRDAVLLFVYSLPRYLVLTFAMSALLAVLTGFGRLSSESETVALHAAGASLPRLAIPGIIFGLIVSFLALSMGEFVVPGSTHAAEVILTHAKAKNGGEKDNVSFFDKHGDSVEMRVSADRVNFATGKMKGVAILEYRDGKPFTLTLADSAEHQERTASEDIWQLSDTKVYTLGKGFAIGNAFPTGTIKYSASPEELAAKTKQNPSEMSYQQLKTQIATLRREGNEKDVIDYEVELPRRLALPFAALVFAIIGTPLGMRSHRRGSSLGVALTVMIVFLYYIFWNWLAITAENGALSPCVAAWLPNAIFTGAGAVLLLTARK